MKYLADTDFLIELYRGSATALDKLRQLDNDQTELCTSTINAAELFEGAYKSYNVTSSLQKVQMLLDAFVVVDFSLSHARNFGELVSRLKGQEIGDMDTLIAAIALADGYQIITNNQKHFERTGVVLVSW